MIPLLRRMHLTAVLPIVTGGAVLGGFGFTLPSHGGTDHDIRGGEPARDLRSSLNASVLLQGEQSINEHYREQLVSLKREGDLGGSRFLEGLPIIGAANAKVWDLRNLAGQ